MDKYITEANLWFNESNGTTLDVTKTSDWDFSHENFVYINWGKGKDKITIPISTLKKVTDKIILTTIDDNKIEITKTIADDMISLHDENWKDED